MSAKKIMLFFPREFDVAAVLPRSVANLGLEMQAIPAGIDFIQVSALRGCGPSLLLMEYSEDAREIIQEMSGWVCLSEKYRDLLLSCRSRVAFHYRNIADARDAILDLELPLKELADQCLMENGEGCLLILSSIFSCLNGDMNWSWERTEFPDLPEVAPSEWDDIAK